MSPPRTLARAALFSALMLAPAAAALTVALPANAQAQRGHAAPDAEAFVQREANQVIGILSDERYGEGQKRQIFRRMIDQIANVPVVTDFVLGKYRRSIAPQQYARFAQTFRLYAYGIYESRLNSYAGQRLEVTGSVERTSDDVIVYSRVIGATKGKSPDVQWRLKRDGAGRWRAVDVNIAGIWLAITQQQDFTSTLDNNGGNIDALIAQLRGQGGSR